MNGVDNQRKKGTAAREASSSFHPSPRIEDASRRGGKTLVFDGGFTMGTEERRPLRGRRGALPLLSFLILLVWAAAGGPF